MQLPKKPEKKFRTSMGFEPVTSRYRCDDLTNFIALLLVRASHLYHEVTGSNPVEVLNFFSGFLRNCINCVHNCEDHSLFERVILLSFSNI